MTQKSTNENIEIIRRYATLEGVQFPDKGFDITRDWVSDVVTDFMRWLTPDDAGVVMHRLAITLDDTTQSALAMARAMVIRQGHQLTPELNTEQHLWASLKQFMQANTHDMTGTHLTSIRHTRLLAIQTTLFADGSEFDLLTQYIEHLPLETLIAQVAQYVASFHSITLVAETRHNSLVGQTVSSSLMLEQQALKVQQAEASKIRSDETQGTWCERNGLTYDVTIANTDAYVRLMQLGLYMTGETPEQYSKRLGIKIDETNAIFAMQNQLQARAGS